MDYDFINEQNKRLRTCKLLYLIYFLNIFVNPLVNTWNSFEIELDRSKYTSEIEYAQNHATFGMYFGLEFIIVVSQAHVLSINYISMVAVVCIYIVL